jgi:hypothetical protein
LLAQRVRRRWRDTTVAAGAPPLRQRGAALGRIASARQLVYDGGDVEHGVRNVSQVDPIGIDRVPLLRGVVQRRPDEAALLLYRLLGEARADRASSQG